MRVRTCDYTDKPNNVPFGGYNMVGVYSTILECSKSESTLKKVLFALMFYQCRLGPWKINIH